MNQLIKRVIAEEMRLARAREEKENETATAPPAEKSLPAAPKATALSSSFASNRGKIPGRWNLDLFPENTEPTLTPP